MVGRRGEIEGEGRDSKRERKKKNNYKSDSIMIVIMIIITMASPSSGLVDKIGTKWQINWRIVKVHDMH